MKHESALMYPCLTIAALIRSRVGDGSVQQRATIGRRSTVYAGPTVPYGNGGMAAV